MFEEKNTYQAKLHPNQSKYFLRQDLSCHKGVAMKWYLEETFEVASLFIEKIMN